MVGYWAIDKIATIGDIIVHWEVDSVHLLRKKDNWEESHIQIMI